VRIRSIPLALTVLVGVLHHHVRGPSVDYIGLFLAAGTSWAGLPGIGETLLIAAGVSAARGHLDLVSVVAVAWAGAATGGTLGWVVGLKGGRELLTAKGPLLSWRMALTARGDRFYERYGTVAVLVTPSWMAGMHSMRPSRFLPVNTISALVWALALGVGAYLVGPSITDAASDFGLAGGAILAALIVLAVVLVVRHRRRGEPPS
jgi:membrane protein DedA with SNARE-associated domain